MKIYLACTVRGDRGGVAAGRAMCERLHTLGHEVLTTHLLADGVDEAEAMLPEADVFRRDLGWLEGCDVLVAEASGSSYGVGFGHHGLERHIGLDVLCECLIGQRRCLVGMRHGIKCGLCEDGCVPLQGKI